MTPEQGAKLTAVLAEAGGPNDLNRVNALIHEALASIRRSRSGCADTDEVPERALAEIVRLAESRFFDLWEADPAARMTSFRLLTGPLFELVLEWVRPRREKYVRRFVHVSFEAEELVKQAIERLQDKVFTDVLGGGNGTGPLSGFTLRRSVGIEGTLSVILGKPAWEIDESKRGAGLLTTHLGRRKRMVPLASVTGGSDGVGDPGGESAPEAPALTHERFVSYDPDVSKRLDLQRSIGRLPRRQPIDRRRAVAVQLHYGLCPADLGVFAAKLGGREGRGFARRLRQHARLVRGRRNGDMVPVGTIAVLLDVGYDQVRRDLRETERRLSDLMHAA